MLGLARTLAHLKVSVWCEQKNITLKAISILYSRGEGKDPEVLVFINVSYTYIYFTYYTRMYSIIIEENNDGPSYHVT